MSNPPTAVTTDIAKIRLRLVRLSLDALGSEREAVRVLLIRTLLMLFSRCPPISHAPESTLTYKRSDVQSDDVRATLKNLYRWDC